MPASANTTRKIAQRGSLYQQVRVWSKTVRRGSAKGHRCVVCGEPILDTELVYRIAKGRTNDGEWDEKTEWGYVHLSCFALATQSPDALLAEMKRQAAT